MNTTLPPRIPSQNLSASLTTAAQSQSWRVGTVLEALALSNAAGGAVRLQIGARVINASTGLAIDAGETLRLRVAQSGSTVVLKPETPNPVPERIRTGIREALPRQSSQTPLLASAAAGARLPLPAVVARALSSLEAAVSDARQLTNAEGLKRAVRDSGNFLEQRLAAGTPSLSTDWKAAMLRARDQFSRWLSGASSPRASAPAAAATANRAPLAATPATPAASPGAAVPAAPPDGAAARVLPLPPAPAQTTLAVAPDLAVTTLQKAQPPAHSAPPMRQTLPAVQPVVSEVAVPADARQLAGQLLEQTDGALARVRLNQLVTVTPEPGSKAAVWLVELPVRHPNGDREILPLRIEREQREGAETAERAWTVDLAFDLGARGGLRARVALHGGRIYTSFQADSDATRATVMAKIDKLAEAMTAREISVGSISCGALPPDPPPARSAVLLDTRA